MSAPTNPAVYAEVSGAVVPGTTTLRITVKWFTQPSSGTPLLTADYDYDLRDRAITDQYIEDDLKRNAQIIADGLRRWTEIQRDLNAVAGQRVRLV